MEERNILSSIIDYIKPKAHDAIDNITTQWEESQSFTDRLTSDEQLNEIVQNFVMGSVGGVGRKALDPMIKRKGVTLLDKIKARVKSRPKDSKEVLSKPDALTVIDEELAKLKKQLDNIPKHKALDPTRGDYGSALKYIKTKETSSSNLKKLLPFLFLQSGAED